MKYYKEDLTAQNMKNKGTKPKPKASPILDTLETTHFLSDGFKANDTNAFGDTEDKKLYTLSELIGSVRYYKRLALDLAAILELHSPLLYDRSQLIKNCGSVITVGLFADGGKKVVHANFCRQRICPMCQRRKSLKTGADILKIQEKLGDGFRWLHLVLTVPNCSRSELNGTVNRLYKTSSEFFKDKRILQGFKGVLRCLEVSYNDTQDNYHPHLHCLIAVKKSYFNSRYYLSSDLLRWKWIYYWGASELLQIHVTACEDVGAVAEVAKYCVKPLDLDLPDNRKAIVTEQMFDTLYGRRLMQTFGVVKEAAKALKIKLDDDIDELLSSSELTDIKHFCYDINEDTYIPGTGTQFTF